MARVLALVPDLLFGSRVQSMLSAEGHDVELLAGEGALRARVGSPAAESAQLLVVDLTNDDLYGPAIVEALAGSGALGELRTLGFDSHVDASARETAERAGFDIVVPRSRMAREGGALVTRLSGGDRGV